MAKPLPIEVILIIAEHLPRGDLARLCLVSKEVSERALSLLYQRLVLKVEGKHLAITRALLKSLRGFQLHESFLSRYATCVKSVVFVSPSASSVNYADSFTLLASRGVLINEMITMVANVIERFDNLEVLYWPFPMGFNGHVQTALGMEFPGSISVPRLNEMWIRVLRLPRLKKIYVFAEILGGNAFKCSGLRSAIEDGIVYEGARGLQVGGFLKLSPDAYVWAAKRLKVDKCLVSTSAQGPEETMLDMCLGMNRMDFEAYKRAMDGREPPRRAVDAASPAFVTAYAGMTPIGSFSFG